MSSVHLAVPNPFQLGDADEAHTETPDGTEPNPYAYDECAAHDGLDTPHDHGEAEAIRVLYQQGLG
jgi:hypothetical protein